MTTTRKLPRPSEIETPPGAEGWQDLYTYPLLFSEDRREAEDAAFWFQDGMHWREVLYPFDATLAEFALTSLSQYNSRFFLVPPAMGIDYRILNGYFYVTPVPVTDGAAVAERVPHFVERAGYYYGNWDALYARWKVKARALVEEMEATPITPLPEMVDLTWITGGRGLGSGYDLLAAYNRLIELAFKGWQYHFELLNLGYAAYLDLFTYCNQVFPGIPEQAVARMVAGINVELFRPDEELRRLARAAVELGVAGILKTAGGAARSVDLLRQSEPGRAWLDALEEAKRPWFNFSSGTGFYHHDKVWLDDLDIPFGFIVDYIGQIEQGVSLDRPLDALRAERERIAGEYEALLSDEAERETFRGKVELARTVFPYIEDHNFYIEHWMHSVLWRKMREIGRLLAGAGFWAEADDIFYLRRDEIPTAIFDLGASWAVGAPSRGPRRWPREVERRKRIVEALRAWTPPLALGVPPEVVNEPFTIMLWGITGERIRSLVSVASETEVRGFPGSPGTVEGVARVVGSSKEIDAVGPGEIIVCPITAPGWAPVFSRAAAAVTDIGGMMSHAAIICREYGLPAVVGTGHGTRMIKTGQRVRVDGTAGSVTIIG